MTPLLLWAAVASIVALASVAAHLYARRKRIAAAAKAFRDEHDAALCRMLIRTAIAQQIEYENGHKERQAERMAHVKHVDHTRHGHYDNDQRAHSVVLRTASAYAERGTKPPAALRDLVLEELGL